MAISNCPYRQFIKSGMEQSLNCSLTGKYCAKQRYCPTQKRLVNTDDWRTCTQFKKEGVQMANKKNTKANKTEGLEIIESVKESTAETEENVENIIIEVEAPRVSEYEVILAKPTYFIINKDGSNVVINEVNEYEKGDMISL